MSHHQSGDPPIGQDPAGVDHETLSECPVEGAQRLVEHDHSGLRGKGPGKGHPLLLATRQIGDRSVFEAIQPDQFQGGGNPPAHLVLWQVCHAEPETDIPENIEVWE